MTLSKYAVFVYPLGFDYIKNFYHLGVRYYPKEGEILKVYHKMFYPTGNEGYSIFMESKKIQVAPFHLVVMPPRTSGL